MEPGEGAGTAHAPDWKVGEVSVGVEARGGCCSPPCALSEAVSWSGGVMRLWLAAVLGPWALLGVWSAPQVKPNLPSITNPTFIEQCEYYHNHFRRLVVPPAANMHYMVGAGWGGFRLREASGLGWEEEGTER